MKRGSFVTRCPELLYTHTSENKAESKAPGPPKRRPIKPHLLTAATCGGPRRSMSFQLQLWRVFFLPSGGGAAAGVAAAAAAAAAAAKVFSSRRGACELGNDEWVRCSGVSLQAVHLEAGSAPASSSSRAIAASPRCAARCSAVPP